MQSQDIIPDDSLIMEMPLVQALSDFNGIPYRQFYGYDFSYETWGGEDITNVFFLIFSAMYAGMPFHFLGLLWSIFRKKIDLSGMKFLRKWAYIYHLAYGPQEVVYYNGVYIFDRFMALTTTAILMWWSFPVFVVYKFLRGKSFDFDFDELDEEDKKYSNKQAVVYHYWGDSFYQTWFAAYKTHWKDAMLAVVGFIPWLVLNVIYWPYKGIMLLSAPLRFTWRALTPWDEQIWEGALLWFSGAEEDGVDAGFPDNLYTNRFMIPKAEEIRQTDIDEILEELAEKAEKDAKKNKD